MKVYVLQIRFSGEEDDVFLFQNHHDAELKVYEYFGEGYALGIDELEQKYFDEDKGYFTISTQTIQ